MINLNIQFKRREEKGNGVQLEIDCHCVGENSTSLLLRYRGMTFGIPKDVINKNDNIAMLRT